MTLRSKYIFRLTLPCLLILASLESKASWLYPPDSAQQTVVVADSTDTTKTRFLNDLEIFLDYGKLITLPFSFEKKGLAGAGIFFGNNFGITVEGGYGKLMPKEVYRDADYTIEGFYGTAGFNYLYEYNPGTRLTLGAKFAESRFSDQGNFTVQNPLWNDYAGQFRRTNLKADWAELVFNSESSFKGNLFLGFMARFRIMIRYPDYNDIPVYAVPGYGRAADKTTPALNIYIKYLFFHEMPAKKE